MDEGAFPRVTTVMADTTDLDGAAAFWTAYLGLEVLQRTERYVYFSKIAGDGPHLAFQLVPEPKQVKNRMHLDIRVADLEAGRERVEELGGREIGRHQDPGFPAWLVMADPQGNEFCIYAHDA